MSDEVSYTIPLDFIDMNYIKRSLNRGRDPLPIWSINDGKQYYSVEILAGKIDSGLHTQNGGQDDSATKTDDTSLIKSYKCPICNFNIPINYWKSHNASLKHKTFLEIADLAMQRIRENMFQNVPDLPPCEDDPSTYFCESCSIPVAIIEKNYHETSDSHALCLKQDNLLHDLLMVYKGNNITVVDTEDNCLEGNLNVENGEVVVDEPKQTNDNVETIKLRKRTRKRKNRNEITPKSDNSSSITNDSYDADPELEILKEYFENVNAKLNGQGKVSVVSEDYLHIFVDDNRLQVNISNFHGFTLMDDSNSTFCVLCRDLIDYTELEAHCKSEKHMDNISMPLYDKHCIRSNKMSAWHAHCILCNKLIYALQMHDHFISADHKHALDQCLINDINNSFKDIPRKTVNFNGENNSDNSLINNDTDTCIEKNDLILTSVLKYPIDTNESVRYQMRATPNMNEVICRVCNVLVPNNTVNITEHIAAVKHVFTYNILLSSHKLKTIENGFICDICHANIINTNELDHIGSKDHKDNAVKCLNKLESKKAMVTAKYCSSCKIYIPYTELDMKVHEASVKHKVNLEKQAAVEKYLVRSETGKGIHYHMRKIKGVTELQCVVCNVLVPNEINHVTIHVTTRKHTSKYNKLLLINKLQKIANGYHCGVCDVNITNMNELSHINGMKHQSKTNTPTQSETCVSQDITQKLDVKSNELNSKHNSDSELHTYADYEKENNDLANLRSNNSDSVSTNSSISLKSTKNTTGKQYCLPCNIYIDTHNIAGHENGQKHLKNHNETKLDSTTSRDTPETSADVTALMFSQPCKALTSNGAASKTNINIDKQIKKTPQSHYQVTSTVDVNMCKVCNVPVPKTNIIEHVMAKKHKSKYNTLLSLNKVCEIENGFRCDVCNVHISKKNELDHINSKGHKNKFIVSVNDRQAETVKDNNVSDEAVLQNTKSESDIGVVENNATYLLCKSIFR